MITDRLDPEGLWPIPGSANVTVSTDHASGSNFPLGTTTVNCSSNDAHGNTSTASFQVTVEDTTPPTLTVPVDFTV